MARNATPLRTPKTRAPKPTKRKSTGAQTASTSVTDQLHSWQLHHRDSARDALRRMRQTPAAERRISSATGLTASR